MRTAALTAFVLTLAACQSCRNTRTPAPPVPDPPKDSGTLADAAGPGPTVLADADAPDSPSDASPSDAGLPFDACLSSTLGNAHAFCDGPLAPFLASVVPSFPAEKVKLAVLKSSVSARTRFVVRHSNGAAAKMKIVVVLTNDGSASALFTLLKKGVAGPTTNLSDGEALAIGRWSASTPKQTVMVAAGKSVKFDPSIEVGLQQKYATMGYYEYSINQPHTVHVCLLGEREDWSVCPPL